MSFATMQINPAKQPGVALGLSIKFTLTRTVLSMLLWRKMMDKMNTNNFKILVEALEALPDDIKNNEVDMHAKLNELARYRFI
jgi:hypothetical protein